MDCKSVQEALLEDGGLELSKTDTAGQVTARVDIQVTLGDIAELEPVAVFPAQAAEVARPGGE